ncbi:MAG: nucleoside monophosphate kinase [Candidatus Berkelbacteria bacterium]|nr:nucleoside monophosphate kinase [Candidatus Berkelbacteria bacterium]
MLPFHIVILGPQGSGKGTQVELLAKKYQMPMLVAGELIRTKAKEASPLGKKIKNLIDNGILIPFDVTKQLFAEALKTIPKTTAVIFDGYPRTMEQVKDFEDLLSNRDVKNKKIIVLEINANESLKRLSKRRICARCGTNYCPPYTLEEKTCQKCHGKLIIRDDDQIDAIKKRLHVYKTETEPVVKHYQKTNDLISINGEQSIEDVNEETVSKLSKISE